MKKNYIFTILLLLLMSLPFAGCEDHLTLVPDSEYSLAGGYKSQNDFQQAIAGVYAQQQELYRSNASWFRGIIARSDDTRGGSLYIDGLDQFIDDANNTWSLPAWNNYWKIINLSNLIIEKIDNGVFNNEEVRGYIKGEAYALRAYAYWSLASQFGGMPLIDKSLSVNEIKIVPRSTQEATFNFAAEDYKKAIDLLPLEWSAGSKGRVTKYAAEGMLARLYMFQSNFAAAKPLLNDIIISGKYGMEEDYENCFNDGFDNGKERVWEVQFTGGQTGEGQFFTTGLLPEGFNNPSIMPFSGYSTAMLVSDDLYNSYEAGDLRRDLSILKGWVSSKTGEVDTISKYVIKYTHHTYTPKDQADWANNLPILRYTDVRMMYAEVLNEEGYVAEGEAFDILNSVRQRAGLAALTSSQLPDKQSFRNALIKERRVEFAFEGLRWPDLIRWGIVTETMNNFFSSPIEGGGRYSMQDFRKVFAIPFDEISRYNDESIMGQNPGY